MDVSPDDDTDDDIFQTWVRSGDGSAGLEVLRRMFPVFRELADSAGLPEGERAEFAALVWDIAVRNRKSWMGRPEEIARAIGEQVLLMRAAASQQGSRNPLEIIREWYGVEELVRSVLDALEHNDLIVSGSLDGFTLTLKFAKGRAEATYGIDGVRRILLTAPIR